MSRACHTETCAIDDDGRSDCVDACATCAGDDECEKHKTYRCATCKRRRPWSDGAADDMPDSCDGCWSMANSDRYANSVRIGDAMERRS